MIARSYCLIAIVALIFPSLVYAYEVVEVCATYVGTDETYKVEANVFDGSELNDRTNSYNWNSYEKYVVIFWDSDQASAIELESSYCDMSFSDCRGIDQQGYIWEITEKRFYNCN